MAWEKKVWVDNQTPLCAENMNHLEDGIDSKVDKSTNKKVLYGTNDKGTAQVVLPYSLLPGDSNIAQFDTGGHLYTKLPSIGDHCANKEYVDNRIADLDSAWLYETHLDEEIWTQLQTNGQISFDQYQGLADYIIKPLLDRVNTPIIRIFCGDSKYIFHYQGYMTYEKGNIYNFLSIINDDKQNPLFLILSVDYVQQLIKLNTFDPNTFTRKYQHTALLKYQDELVCYYIFEDTTATKYETIEALIKARGWVNDEFNPNIFTLHENTIVGNGLMVHNNTDLVVSLNGHLIQNFDSITDTVK